MINLIHNKFGITAGLLRRDVRTLLDVGCRDAALKKSLGGDISYHGLDLLAGPGVDQVADVEGGLPFADRTFDAVIALDLLEHTNHIWFVYDELMRVAAKQVIVLLPNAYHWRFRLWYLRGKEMDKYVLSSEPILDRHRWLISYNTAHRFCFERARARGWHVSELRVYGGRRTAWLDWLLSSFSKNLGTWSTIVVLDRPAEAASAP
jgi:hypothetical protein